MIDLKKEYAKRLLALEKNLTAQDKLDALDEVGISRPTLEKYLQGDAVKFDTAEKLIQFFMGRIQARFDALKESTLI